MIAMMHEFYLSQFTDYLNDFYGPNGIYSTDGRTTRLTMSEVKLAVALASERGHVFDTGDTFDREVVRDILIEMNIINPFPKATAEGITGALL